EWIVNDALPKENLVYSLELADQSAGLTVAKKTLNFTSPPGSWNAGENIREEPASLSLNPAVVTPGSYYLTAFISFSGQPAYERIELKNALYSASSLRPRVILGTVTITGGPAGIASASFQPVEERQVACDSCGNGVCEIGEETSCVLDCQQPTVLPPTPTPTPTAEPPLPEEVIEEFPASDYYDSSELPQELPSIPIVTPVFEVADNQSESVNESGEQIKTIVRGDWSDLTLKLSLLVLSTLVLFGIMKFRDSGGMDYVKDFLDGILHREEYDGEQASQSQEDLEKWFQETGKK
ncbi:MAG: hypothetical protein V1717_03980, partial [Candidatus Micrarchaeota archaeon]